MYILYFQKHYYSFKKYIICAYITSYFTSFSSLLLSFLLSSGPSETGGLAPAKNRTVVAVHYIKIPQGGKGRKEMNDKE